MNQFCEITPELRRLAAKSAECSKIDPELYTRYDVKRGLRDLNGKGVLVGLTEISEVSSTKIVNGESVPADGELFYRGYNVKDLIAGLPEDSHFGFEECTYLLLFGKLPKKHELRDFSALLSSYRTLPTSFVRDIIMKAPSKDMMNTLARSVLTLYSYDEMADDVSLPNVLRQCLQLISLFPLLSVYGYQAYKHYHDGASLFIHSPKEEYSTAENILHILRPDSKFSPLEAKLLDIALILHMEHGGGNNSTFTTHLVSSSGTDTYSVIAASLGSLKGPKHGGANIKVVRMFDDMKANLKDWTDEEEISRYLTALLHKEAFDHAGLIYGMGHAVYSLSDPRAQIFRGFVKRLSAEKGYEKNSHSTRQWNVLPRRSLPPSARSIKVSARMSTSSADSPTACSDFRSNSTRRFSPSRESPDGVRTVWRKLQAAARSCVLPTKTSASIRFMSRWMSVSDFHCTPCSKKPPRTDGADKMEYYGKYAR